MSGSLRWFLACALASTSCAHFLKLDPKNVTALEVSGDAKAQICARGALVDVLAVDKDGKKHPEGDREHPRENEFDPALVNLEASVGGFHDRSWNPPDDPLALLSVDEIDVKATLIANAQVTATTKVSPTWACDAPVAYLGGQDGPQGSMGTQDGQDGDPGADGGGGQNVVVTIGWVQHGNGRLAIADLQSDSGESVYVLDPTTPLKVFSSGGAGGPGGTGAYGRGMDNCEGRGGPGGRGGLGGNGGDGGDVTIRYDASSPELQQLVLVDVHGGEAGPGGPGGGGGAGPNGCGTWGSDGKEGQEGRAGRDGRVTQQAIRGINEQLGSLSHGGPRPAVQVAARPPQPERPRPGAPGGRPAPRETADGARYYAGHADITATLPRRKPGKERFTIQVESTRTRRRHFTIVFGDCKLDFHRPPGESRHRYALDAPASCSSAAGAIQISDALLELDTKADKLALSWHGTGKIQGQPGPLKVDFAFSGDRH